MKRILILLLIAAGSHIVLAQGEIPVNMYTGQPGIFVNLYTLTDHDLSESLTMSYSLNSVNLNSGSAYGGWNLGVGGQISREVRGLPDDFVGTGSDTRKGWLYNSNYSNVLQFPASASLSACDAFQNDFDYLKNLQYLTDTEPDLFSFSVGSYSGKFVFDNAGNIQLIPYQDLTIVPTYNNPPTDKSIIGWTITTNTGVTYTLNEQCAATRYITKTTNQQYVSMFDRLYNLYQTKVAYTSAWMLTKSQSTSGATINYFYSTPGGVSKSANTWPVKLFDPKAGTTSAIFNLMTDSISSTGKIVYKMTTSTGKRVTCDPQKGVINIYDTLRTPTFYKKFSLTYTSGILTSIAESSGPSCTQLPPYTFTYNGWSGSYVNSASQDFWGFFNGRNSTASRTTVNYFPTVYVYPNEAANERYRLYRIPNYSGSEIILGGDSTRTPSATAIVSGTLSSIVYPTGGEADFTYEINKYYDTKAGKDQMGGGLRIKSITYKDKLNPSGDITRNYSYVDANGHSSGRLMSLPSFTIPLWEQKIPTDATAGTTAHSVLYSALSGNAKWTDLLAITSIDISNTNSYVGYTHVTETRPGNGKTVVDYAAPAAFGDATIGTDSTAWSPTVMKFARPTTCPTMANITTGESYGYPSFPQAEFDYERGLAWKRTEFNEIGSKVRETRTTYQYIFKPGKTPKKVTGLAYDLYANGNSTDANSNPIFLYGEYSLLTNISKVASLETVRTYDEKDSTRSSFASTQYSYTSGNHRFLNQVKTTVADGTVYGTYLKYVPDFPATSSQSDINSYMLYQLKTTNHTNTVIEQYSTVQPVGGTEKITGSSLTLFRPFTFNRPLVSHQLAFRPSAPISLNSFTYANVNGSDVFSKDSRYDTVVVVNEYDNYNVPISTTNESKITGGTLMDAGYQRLPIVSFSQATSANIAFSDFELTTPASFSVQQGYYGTGRTGTKGIHPYGILTRTVTKPANTTNYLLSFWAMPVVPQTQAQSITLTVKLTYGSTNMSTNYTFNFDQNINDYQYFTKLIDISAVNTSTFTVQVQGYNFTQPSGTILPLLDDIGFYPDYASLSSVTYDIPFGVNSSTGPSGNTSYTVYDDIGRAKWILDQDHNIRKRYTYNLTGQIIAPVVAAVSTINGSAITNNAITLTAVANPCYANATYEWNFNDGAGYSAPSTSTTSPSHTYTTIGAKTVNLRVNGSVVGTYTVNVVSSFSTLTASIASSGVDANNMVTLTATPANDNGQPVSYQWFSRNTGATTWYSCGAPSSTYTRKIPLNNSIDFKCTVTTSDGRTANSNVVTVANAIN